MQKKEKLKKTFKIWYSYYKYLVILLELINILVIYQKRLIIDYNIYFNIFNITCLNDILVYF